MAMIGSLVEGRAVLLAGFVCAALAVVDAHALPLFARQTGEACSACHAGGHATDKIGGFVPQLSVNAAVAAAPSYVPLSVLLGAPFGRYGGSVGFLSRSGPAEVRNLTLDGFWRRGQNLRVGAQYTLFNRDDGAANGSDPAARRDAGTLFIYLQRSY